MSEQQGFSSRRLVFVVAAAASLLLLASLLAVIFGQTRESALAQSKASLDGKAYVLNRQIAQTFAKVDVVLRLVARTCWHTCQARTAPYCHRSPKWRRLPKPWSSASRLTRP